MLSREQKVLYSPTMQKYSHIIQYGTYVQALKNWTSVLSDLFLLLLISLNRQNMFYYEDRKNLKLIEYNCGLVL